MLLNRVLSHLVVKGDLTVTDWHGRQRRFGDGSAPRVHIHITEAAAARALSVDPDLKLGECYVDGSLRVLSGTIYDLLALAMMNTSAGSAPVIHDLVDGTRRAFRRLHQYNPVGRAKANVAHHYDLSGALYDLFLDADRQYSCAYFTSHQASLEEAQLAKKRHIAAKLDLHPGMRVLDIGSGWGGLGLYLARQCGVDVTGVTLSEEQHVLSNARAAEQGLEGRVRFALQDYRTLTGQFDRIVSVGMFEHVGIGHFPEFFQSCARLLKDDGVALLHSINRSAGPGATSAWIKKYIFPGGYIPALSEVLPHMEESGLYVTDIEILRLHYAETLRHWRMRFAANRAAAAALYDENFCRMWEFYLAGSECAFRFGGMNNFQIQFGKNQHVLPMTRDYIAAAEARLAAAELPARRKVAAARRTVAQRAAPRVRGA